MKFRTEYRPEKSELTLSPSLPLVLVGSCFTQNIAEKMSTHLWTASNPCGTLYNPLSISTAVKMMADDSGGGEEMFIDSLFHAERIWHSGCFDSSFSSVDKEDCIQQFRQSSIEFRSMLEKGKTLIATFGTSICYFRNSDSQMVGNCHKQPANLYFRRRLGIDEIIEEWTATIDVLSNRFPGLNIIFTVSPIRHIKDGFAANSRSKAVLQLAVEEICLRMERCYYFPAFEILNDDLRDYRFYASDLVHPSEMAIEYIWDIFKATFLDDKGLEMIAEGAGKYKAGMHRPLSGALGKPLSR